ncbi:AAA family ATPase [Nodularia spumigena]|uniref:Abortive infection protein n=1 Tax=Nodularia spumigena CENA596 TaxID=1819295 RepID=A0A161XP14_NODSP|nr:ATP-binding protein [Nodularia spumigena]KZL50624.1 abortive infection protein [Nodularia spumigena CENA596]MEA5556581.1 ATP-binding protein [Nodularia spumigena CH309]
MLIEFSIGNYRSFKDKVTFSMVAANIVAKDPKIDENNTFAVDDKLTLLKSAAIYGANASGKSNLAKAISFMKWFMINSSKETQSTEEIGVEPFRLSTETETEPSLFEIVFLLDGKKYRYGFEATQQRVISEWLFYVPNKRETRIFERNFEESTEIFNISKIFKGGGIDSKTRHNALFLSVAAQFNVEIAEKILDWLTRKLKIISGLDDISDYTVSYLAEGNDNRSDIIQLIKKLDLGIREITVKETEIRLNSLPLPEDTSEELKKMIVKSGIVKATLIKTVHQKFDSQGNHISLELFDLYEHESEGTQKIVSIAGILVDTFKNGDVLIFDEFDARLHPLITKAIVEIFNSQETNYNNAQLIFMTHDTNLLSNKLFRRDQIWFTEKNKYGATDLYSLVEYPIRNDASFENDYIQGKYGAIPFIGNLSQILGNPDA